MFIALCVVLPGTLLFLLWFYLFRNNTSVPVTAGSRFFFGHMHHFFNITKETAHKFEEKYFDLTNPSTNGQLSHLKFFFTSNFSLNSVRVAEALLKSNVNINKSAQYDTIKCWLGGSVFLLPGEKWKVRRHVMTPAFHFRILDDFTETMKRHGTDMISRVEASMDDEGYCSLVKVLERVTFASLFETSFNTKFKDAADLEKYFEVIDSIGYEIFTRDMSSFLDQVDWWWSRTANGKKCMAGIADANAKFLSLIEERREDLKNGTTKLHNGKMGFLDLMVYEQQEKNELTDDEIIGECNTIMLAGHATTTGTVAFCVYFLCKHPHIQEKMYEEISSNIEGNDFSTLDPNNLTYTTTVVKETLRIQPPAGVIGRQLSEPLEVDGHVIPTGSYIDVSIWWMHRDPEHWDDPETFDPERFSVENSKGRHPYAFVPFSAGPRNCIGQRFALYEAKILIAALVHKFKMSSKRELGVDMVRTIQGVSAVPGPDFRVQFTPRQ